MGDCSTLSASKMQGLFLLSSIFEEGILLALCMLCNVPPSPLAHQSSNQENQIFFATA